MASRSANCRFCGNRFDGWGETAQEAQNDADTQAAHHAHECACNPANEVDDD